VEIGGAADGATAAAGGGGGCAGGAETRGAYMYESDARYAAITFASHPALPALAGDTTLRLRFAAAAGSFLRTPSRSFFSIGSSVLRLGVSSLKAFGGFDASADRFGQSSCLVREQLLEAEKEEVAAEEVDVARFGYFLE